MPTFQPPLSETQAPRNSGRPPVDLTLYLEYLANLAEGYIGHIDLEEGEKKPTIKNHLLAASAQLGKELKFRRSTETTVYFQTKTDKEISGQKKDPKPPRVRAKRETKEV